MHQLSLTYPLHEPILITYTYWTFSLRLHPINKSKVDIISDRKSKIKNVYKACNGICFSFLWIPRITLYHSNIVSTIAITYWEKRKKFVTEIKIHKWKEDIKYSNRKLNKTVSKLINFRAIT